jgi:hypothetical protein
VLSVSAVDIKGVVPSVIAAVDDVPGQVSVRIGVDLVDR